MDNAEKVTEEQRNERDFYLNDDQVEKCLEGAVRLDDKSLPINNSGRKYIPTNRFNHFEVTRYAFGKYADKYGKSLEKYGINEMNIYLANMQDKPFARKLWFCSLDCSLDNSSVLFCDNRDLFNYYLVRGIKENKKN